MGPMAFKEAIEWARGRDVVLPSAYYGDMQGFARAKAFSIAGVAKLDQLQAVMNSLADATETGESFQDWQARVRAGDIPLALPDHRLDNIFRTNLQNHFGRGRCEQQSRNLKVRPWFLYDAVNDARTRPSHGALDGKVARFDDAFWAQHTPPNGFRCRCRRIALNAQQAARYQAEDDARMARNNAARDARLAAMAKGPDTGWDYSPCQRPEAGVPESVDRAKEQTNPTIWAAAEPGLLEAVARMIALRVAMEEAARREALEEAAKQAAGV